MPVLSSITPETDKGYVREEKFTTEKGTDFTINPGGSALWTITMHGGGKSPSVCDDRFTSYNKARQELIRYINETDRLGYAVHPEKKVRVNGASEAK